MANAKHVALLRNGVDAWNAWRDENPDIHPDLVRAHLSREYLVQANLEGADLAEVNLEGANLEEANLSGAELYRANLEGANLNGAKLARARLLEANLAEATLERATLEEAVLVKTRLRHANLSGAMLPWANLIGADLTGANLTKTSLASASLTGAELRGAHLQHAYLGNANLTVAHLEGANLSGADLSEADLDQTYLADANLSGANLERARLVRTDLTGADLNGCRIYGLSVWGITLEGTRQQNLIITHNDEPEITIDNIEVAQFIYLILNNQKLRDVVDAITSKAVLILGRFGKRKPVLDALRDELRKHKYIPILFDFEAPATRDVTETVTLLARMARFIIADITDPSSVPKELEAIVPGLAVPVQPLLEGATRPYAMFKDYWKYDWVLPIYRYEGLQELLAALTQKVIAPAEGKLRALEERRRMIEAELVRPQ